MTTKFETLIRTGRLHQLESADSALDEAGIPHYLQEECVSGLITAMPVDPSPAPGTWWSILVPSDHLNTAKEVVRMLPFDFTTEPEIWDCSPSPRGRLVVSLGIWIVIAGMVAMAILAMMKE